MDISAPHPPTIPGVPRPVCHGYIIRSAINHVDMLTIFARHVRSLFSRKWSFNPFMNSWSALKLIFTHTRFCDVCGGHGGNFQPTAILQDCPGHSTTLSFVMHMLSNSLNSQILALKKNKLCRLLCFIISLCDREDIFFYLLIKKKN